MKRDQYVGRKDAIIQLRSVLQGDMRSTGKLTVQSIEGPGGIGKTSLFDHVLFNADIDAKNYLTLRLDGHSVRGRGLVDALMHMINSAESPVIRKKPPAFYFPSVVSVVKVIEQIKAKAVKELKSKEAGSEGKIVDLLKILDDLIALGKAVNDASPAIKKKIDFYKLEVVRDLTNNVIPKLQSLKCEVPYIWERLGLGGETSLSNSVKENACKALTDAFLSDLSAILYGYKGGDWFKPMHKKINGVDRLLMVIDDYEATQNVVGEFLVGSLLPRLKMEGFETLLIIMGRDQLEATHPAWDQHLKVCMQRRINLDPLEKSEMELLVKSFGVESKIEMDQAWRDTQGYPFYVQLWVEEAEAGGKSALMLKRFYDRTTRWMNSEEQEWLQQIIFMDSVNVRKLTQVFEDEQKSRKVYKWFEREGSVRDPHGSEFCVRQYLRSRLLEYLKISDPERFESLANRARVAGCAVIEA